jgi:sialate O-acetylesterase
MIADWRKVWGEGDFPFLFVQLAPYHAIMTKPVTGSTWAELREAQRLTLQNSPNTGMAVLSDVGDQGNIHPTRKEPVGVRLALWARAVTYGEKIEYTGPTFAGATVQGNAIKVAFTHAAGLSAGQINDVKADGAVVATPDKLVGFEVAGADKAYHAADAKIDGTNVIVSSPDVPTPVAVRYGWADYPVANLQNGAGLWASSFSSDAWPWSTGPNPTAPAPNPVPAPAK